MRVAVLVLSLFLMVVVLFQSCAAGAVGAINSAIGKDAAETAQFAQGGAIGFAVAFLMWQRIRNDEKSYVTLTDLMDNVVGSTSVFSGISVDK